MSPQFNKLSNDIYQSFRQKYIEEHKADSICENDVEQAFFNLLVDIPYIHNSFTVTQLNKIRGDIEDIA